MLSISPLSNERSAIQVPPPRDFKSLRGPPRDVKISSVPYARKRGNTTARESGLRYEDKVQAALTALFGTYVTEPELEFWGQSGARCVRPDGILVLEDRVVVFEIKLQHMPEAWWQLRKLYGPVLAVGTKRPAQLVEIVRSYDPATPFNEPIELVPDLRTWVEDPTKLGVFGVSICRL